MQSARRVFVTGGNGFLGSAVVRRLCEEGWAVRCLLRKTSRTRRIDDLPVERVLGDIRSADGLREAMHGCHAVVHLASIASWNGIHGPELERVVVDGTRNVVRAAEGAGDMRVVYVSSAAAINGTQVPVVQDESARFSLDPRKFAYSAAKRRAESLVHHAAERGLHGTIVNPVEVYGPRDDDFVTASNILQWLTSPVALVCRGGTAIAHVDDVAAGIVAALGRGRIGERYVLGGDNLTIKELALLVLQVAGITKRPVVSLPTGLLRLAAGVSKRARLPFPVPPELIPYATTFWFFSAEKARRELGARFRSAAEVLAPTIEWLAEEGHWRRS